MQDTHAADENTENRCHVPRSRWDMTRDKIGLGWVLDLTASVAKICTEENEWHPGWHHAPPRGAVKQQRLHRQMRQKACIACPNYPLSWMRAHDCTHAAIMRGSTTQNGGDARHAKPHQQQREECSPRHGSR